MRLDANGQVRFANAAAQPWLRDCIELSATFAGLIAAVKRGRLALPKRLSVLDECHHCTNPPLEVWLDHASNHCYVLLILPRVETSLAVLGQGPAYGGNFLNLIGENLRDEIARMCNQLDTFGQSDIVGAPSASAISTWLREIGNLAELYQHDQPFSDERFGLAPLLAEILPGLPRQSGPFAIRHSYLEGPGIGQIYGHRAWMKQALNSLLGRLGEDCPPGYQVDTTLRQKGDFVIVTGNISVDRTRPALVSGTAARPDKRHGLSLRVCQRIFELHGGVFKIEHHHHQIEPSISEPGIDYFVLTLPTGLPSGDRSSSTCARCPMALQAQENIRDLVELMAMRAGTNVVTKTSKENHEQDPDR